MPEVKIINNDCLIALKEYPDNHFDSVVSDPPYGINFMQKKWDYDVPSVELWKEVLRVLKPGGHILIACGTRTQHRMAVNIEDAGFEIRDIISWIYGSGFPKALDVSKAIDQHFNKERKVVGQNEEILKKQSADIKKGKRKILDSFNAGAPERNNGFKTISADITEPATEEAKKFNGWKTALKPAQELWTLARKPLSEDTIAENVLKHGTGAINIDGTRIELNGDYKSMANGRPSLTGLGDNYDPTTANQLDTKGRFPANVIFDEESGKLLDEQSGHLKSGNVAKGGFKGKYKAAIYGQYANGIINPETVYADSGGASRFFYCAKASGSERNKGLENMDFKKSIGHNRFDKCTTCGKYILQNPDRPSACQCKNPEREDNVISGNFHPTVKPVSLMRYLVRMITPKGGLVLDPFNGSGTTGIACKVEGFNYVGIEREKEYCDISRHRIEAWILEEDEVNDKKESIIKSGKKEADKDKEQPTLF